MIPVSQFDYIYRADLIRVIDGDTLRVYAWKETVGVGIITGRKLILRLHGINAPKLEGVEREAGLAAGAALLRIVSGTKLTFTTFKDRMDPWQRYIAVLYAEGLEGTVNDWMVKNGHAVYHRYKEE